MSKNIALGLRKSRACKSDEIRRGNGSAEPVGDTVENEGMNRGRHGTNPCGHGSPRISWGLKVSTEAKTMCAPSWYTLATIVNARHITAPPSLVVPVFVSGVSFRAYPGNLVVPYQSGNAMPRLCDGTVYVKAEIECFLSAWGPEHPARRRCIFLLCTK